MSELKTAAELSADPAGLDEFDELLAAATNRIERLPVDEHQRLEAIYSVQQGLDTVVGCIAWRTGGIRVDEGWIQLLGSGHPRLAGIHKWNGRPDALIVGFDVIGGIFAIDYGGLQSQAMGHVCYFAPDKLQWQDLGADYLQVFRWIVAGDIDKFYQGIRWPGWREHMLALEDDQGFLFTPPLWEPAPRGRRHQPARLGGLLFDNLAQSIRVEEG